MGITVNRNTCSGKFMFPPRCPGRSIGHQLAFSASQDIEHVTGGDPGKRDRLLKGLDVFLERNRDRELFDLPLNKEKADGNPD